MNLADAPLPARDPMRPQLYRIARHKRELADTFTWDLVLAEPTSAPPFVFQAGQFNMLYVFPVGEVPISISGDPGAKDERVVHTIRAVGAVTRAMQGLRQGATVGLRGPYGTAWPIEQAEGCDIILVAGGIGLAPLRPAIFHILRYRERYGRFIILYGARRPADLLYRKELERWRGRLDTQMEITVDIGLDGWRGDVGLVTQLFSRIQFDVYHTMAMLCGPEIMMRFAARELLERSLPAEQIYLSMERNMKCAVGWCGHCQLGPTFICKDGPVFPYPTMQPWLGQRER